MSGAEELVLPASWSATAENKHSTRWMRFLGRITSPKMLRSPALLEQTLRGQVVVITGASSGLGASLASHCAAAGAYVVICARSTQLLEQVAEKIRRTGGHVDIHTMDLADDAQIMSFASKVLAKYGRVDVLVHNAGKSLNRAIHLSYRRPKDLHASIAANYIGPVRLTMALLPYMRARGSGHIVNISTSGVLGPPNPKWGFYLASKIALDWFLRAAAPEATQDGVVITQYYLGSVRTKMSAPGNVQRRFPSQSADEAAWGVAHALVHRPRAHAWRPMYAINVVAVAFRFPIEKALRRSVRAIPETRASLERAVPQEEFVSGDPKSLAASQFLDTREA
ncbi:putative Short-chain dehydrogenase/reductase [Mycobacteroides stephanolepidis]|uniref:Putative Short-chain dehydrogenase/reductase n=2 Tax=[Mycobacterium] stephanolepidis TaxID=1520670 RepID=A0A1Z4F0Q8_9MYCO|nr:putative Short-chain dehydrogenase/reductase [[Mycobacterium] stephanolepidis]